MPPSGQKRIVQSSAMAVEMVCISAFPLLFPNFIKKMPATSKILDAEVALTIRLPRLIDQQELRKVLEYLSVLPLH